MGTLQKRVLAAFAAVSLCTSTPFQRLCAQEVAPSGPPPPQLNAEASARSINLGSRRRHEIPAQFQNFDSAQINVGRNTRTVVPSDLLTPAELAALRQVLTTGEQTLVLGRRGSAVGGTVDLTADLQSAVQNLVIPSRVTALHDFARSAVTLSGDFRNGGTFYAVSSNAQTTVASISADNIHNQAGALLSSVLPAGGLSGFTSATPHLDLSLSAVHDIVNAGTIRSSGNLTMTAGGSIINQGAMSAAQNVTMSSAVGNIVNSGMITALVGNLNLASVASQNLLINNIDGALQALEGSIDIRDLSESGLANMDLLGGSWLSKEVNVFARQGEINANIEEITGTLNATGGAAHILASSKVLTLGNIKLTGDPTFYNDATNGDILLSGNISFPERITIAASRNISTSNINPISITARDGDGQGYDINLFAGVDITPGATSTASTSLPPGNPVPTDESITINGPSATGGDIRFTSAVTIDSSSTESGMAGGNIGLYAFRSAGGDRGAIIFAEQSQLIANGKDAANGNVRIIAGGIAALPDTILRAPSISNFAGTANTGDILIVAGQPTVGTGITADHVGQISADPGFDTTGSGGAVQTLATTTIHAGRTIEIKLSSNGLLIHDGLMQADYDGVASPSSAITVNSPDTLNLGNFGDGTYAVDASKDVEFTAGTKITPLNATAGSVTTTIVTTAGFRTIFNAPEVSIADVTGPGLTDLLVTSPSTLFKTQLLSTPAANRVDVSIHGSATGLTKVEANTSLTINANVHFFSDQAIELAALNSDEEVDTTIINNGVVDYSNNASVAGHEITLSRGNGPLVIGGLGEFELGDTGPAPGATMIINPDPLGELETKFANGTTFLIDVVGDQRLLIDSAIVTIGNTPAANITATINAADTAEFTKSFTLQTVATTQGVLNLNNSQIGIGVATAVPVGSVTIENKAALQSDGQIALSLAANGTLTNNGIMQSQSSISLNLGASGTLTNNGRIESSQVLSLTFGANGTLTNNGVIKSTKTRSSSIEKILVVNGSGVLTLAGTGSFMHVPASGSTSPFQVQITDPTRLVFDNAANLSFTPGVTFESPEYRIGNVAATNVTVGLTAVENVVFGAPSATTTRNVTSIATTLGTLSITSPSAEFLSGIASGFTSTIDSNVKVQSSGFIRLATHTVINNGVLQGTGIHSILRITLGGTGSFISTTTSGFGFGGSPLGPSSIVPNANLTFSGGPVAFGQGGLALPGGGNATLTSDDDFIIGLGPLTFLGVSGVLTLNTVAGKSVRLELCGSCPNVSSRTLSISTGTVQSNQPIILNANNFPASTAPLSVVNNGTVASSFSGAGDAIRFTSNFGLTISSSGAAGGAFTASNGGTIRMVSNTHVTFKHESTNTPLVTFNGGGDVFLSAPNINLQKGAIVSATGESQLTVDNGNATGALNITVSEGTAGTLSTVGNLVVQNNDETTGQIMIGAGANLIAGGTTNDPGDVFVVIGEIPATPVLGVAPPGVIAEILNGGQILWGNNSITASATTEVSANRGRVVFNTGALPRSAITLDEDVRIGTAGAPRLRSLDLTDPATTAFIIAQIQAKNIKGKLTVDDSGSAIKGKLTLTPFNVDPTLSAENIPLKTVKLTLKNFDSRSPLNILINSSSTESQVLINGTHQYTTRRGDGVINIISALGGPVLTLGTTGSLKTKGSLTINAGGNVALNGKVLAKTDIAITTTANSQGDISVATKLGKKGTTALVADGSGDISQTAGKHTIRGSTVTLTSGTGNVGSLENHIRTQTTSLVLHNGGTGVLFVDNKGNLTLADDSTGGADFRLATTGVFNVGKLTAAGSINLVATGGGLLNVLPGKTIKSNGGNITLQHVTESSKAIVIGDGSTIFADASGPPFGNVAIFAGVGQPPEANTTAPANVTQHIQSGGAIFYGANGITALGPTNADITAKGAKVTFSTGAAAASAITLGSGVIIIADPPVSLQAPSVVQMRQPADLSSDMAEAAHSPSRIPDISSSLSNKALSPQPGNAGTTLAPALPSRDPSVNTLIPIAYVRGAAAELRGESLQNRGDSARTKLMNGKNGEALLTPTQDVSVPTVAGELRVAARSSVLCLSTPETLFVFNFHDTRRGAVKLVGANQEVHLAPGHVLALTDGWRGALASNHPARSVGYRQVRQFHLGEGISLVTAEFSLPSALQTLDTLRRLQGSREPEHKKAFRQIMKAAAVLSALNGRGEPYRALPLFPIVSNK